MDLPGTKVRVAACLWRMRLTTAWVTPMQPAIALCHIPSPASASTSCLILIGVGRGIIRMISENWEKKCNCWFELATVRMHIWGTDHLRHWSENPAKVRSDLVGEQSLAHFMSISAQWRDKKSIPIDFIAPNMGVTTVFPRVYHNIWVNFDMSPMFILYNVLLLVEN